MREYDMYSAPGGSRKEVADYLLRKKQDEEAARMASIPPNPYGRSDGDMMYPEQAGYAPIMPPQAPPQAPQAAPEPPSADTINIDDIPSQPPLVNPQAVQGNTKLMSRAAPILAQSADELAAVQRAASDKERFAGQDAVGSEIQAGLARLNGLRPSNTQPAPQTPSRDWMAELEAAQGANRFERSLTAGANLFALAGGHNVSRLAAADREGEVNRRMAVEEYVNRRNTENTTARNTAQQQAEANDPNSALSIASRRNLFATAQALNAAGMEDAARTTAAMAADNNVSHATIAQMAADETNPLQQILRAAVSTNGQSLRFLAGRENNATRTGIAGLNAATDITTNTNDNATRLALEVRKARTGGRAAAAGMSTADKARLAATDELIGHAGGDESRIEEAAQRVRGMSAEQFIATVSQEYLGEGRDGVDRRYSRMLDRRTDASSTGYRQAISGQQRFRSALANSRAGDYVPTDRAVAPAEMTRFQNGLVENRDLQRKAAQIQEMLGELTMLEENTPVFSAKSRVLASKIAQLQSTYAALNQGVFGALQQGDREMIEMSIPANPDMAFINGAAPMLINDIAQGAENRLQDRIDFLRLRKAEPGEALPQPGQRSQPGNSRPQGPSRVPTQGFASRALALQAAKDAGVMRGTITERNGKFYIEPRP